MRKKRFSTDRAVLALHPLKGQTRTDYYHATETGFILRVSDKSKVWMVSHTVKAGGRSKRRKVTLGMYPDISLADALDLAKETKADGRQKGTDIVGARMDRKAAATVKQVMGHYFKETVMAPRTIAESKRISDKDIIPLLGDLKAMDLTRQDVKSLHKRVTVRGSKVMANRTVELLRRAYNCAHEEELIKLNPYPNIRKIKSKERPRERILTDAEIKELWVAMEDEPVNMRDVLRLLLLLGQRSMETMSMQVTDIDQGRKEWTIPAGQTKTGKPNVVPLPPLAWEIIKPRLENNEWVFPSKYNRTRGVSRCDGHTKSTKDARRRLRKATGIGGWTGHDLRRTCRTIMARESVLPHIAEQVLGHAQAGIEGVYDQHGYIKEKRKALRVVDTVISSIMGIGKQQAKVIPLMEQI